MKTGGVESHKWVAADWGRGTGGVSDELRQTVEDAAIDAIAAAAVEKAYAKGYAAGMARAARIAESYAADAANEERAAGARSILHCIRAQT